MNTQLAQIDAIYRTACTCRDCFQNIGLQAAFIDKAQPRWVGPQYWDADKRILAVMLIPGSGTFRSDPGMQATLDLLQQYCKGTATLNQVFDYQRHDMDLWGRGRRFLTFIEESLGLDISKVAFMNLAWCANKENYYPPRLLRTCIERHGLALVKTLNPTHVLLCGSTTQRYAKYFSQTVPSATIIDTLHYAHREGAAREAVDCARVRNLLS